MFLTFTFTSWCISRPLSIVLTNPSRLANKLKTTIADVACCISWRVAWLIHSPIRGIGKDGAPYCQRWNFEAHTKLQSSNKLTFTSWCISRPLSIILASSCGRANKLIATVACVGCLISRSVTSLVNSSIGWIGKIRATYCIVYRNCNNCLLHYHVCILSQVGATPDHSPLL